MPGLPDRVITLTQREQDALTAHGLARSTSTADALDIVSDWPAFRRGQRGYNYLNRGLTTAAKKAGLTRQQLVANTKVIFGHLPEEQTGGKTK